jgi:hypothetical protein
MLLTTITPELDEEDELDERPEELLLVPLEDFDLRAFFFFFCAGFFFFAFLSTEDPELLDEEEPELLLLELPLDFTFLPFDLLELDEDFEPLFLTLRFDFSDFFFDLSLLDDFATISLYPAATLFKLLDRLSFVVIIFFLLLPPPLDRFDKAAKTALLAKLDTVLLRRFYSTPAKVLAPAYPLDLVEAGDLQPLHKLEDVPAE